MADSQASPGSADSQGTGTAQVTGEPGDTTRSDSVSSAASQSQPSEAELDEITRTVSAGGEKAVGILKHWQRVASEKDQQLATFKQAEDLFKTLGGGDVSRGIEAAQAHLGNYNAVVTNPEAREAIQHFLATGEWKPKDMKQDDLGLGFDDDIDPTMEQLNMLKREVQELRGGSAIQQMKGYLDGFFGKEIAEGITLGSVLNDDEKSKILSGLESQIKSMASNDAGQQTLRKMGPRDVQHMLQLQLPPEKWFEIGERGHLQKIERKKGAATGVASAGGTTGNEDRSYSNDSVTALTEWAREHGVDLYNVTGGSR